MATHTTPKPSTRRRRADGARSHEAILHAAAQLATVEGLDGLSIGRLAEHIGMSKSGLFAHFGSKEELQLATIAKAREVFDAEVVDTALTRPEGVARVEALAEGFLSHVEREVFIGGCFFASAAAELDTRPGAVRDQVVEFSSTWWDLIESNVRAAQAAGELDGSIEARQLTFELEALLLQANASWLLLREPSVFVMARRAFADRLARAAA